MYNIYNNFNIYIIIFQGPEVCLKTFHNSTAVQTFAPMGAAHYNSVTAAETCCAVSFLWGLLCSDCCNHASRSPATTRPLLVVRRVLLYVHKSTSKRDPLRKAEKLEPRYRLPGRQRQAAAPGLCWGEI